MSSIAPLNPNALLPAMPSIILPLEHFESNDYFRQMLSMDSALEALSMSENNLKLKFHALAISEGISKKRPERMPDPKFLIGLHHYKLSAQGAAEYEALLQSSANLDTLVRTFEELQAAARHRFEQNARSLRQEKTGIMDLPHEVLLMIFKNFRRPLDDYDFCPPGDETANTRTIMNIRLTCLRFCQISSQLLVRDIKISPSTSSLQRLGKVASHSEISKGERVLRIDLRYYSANLARDLQAFSIMCFKKLQQRIEHFERVIKDQKREADRKELTEKWQLEEERKQEENLQQPGEGSEDESEEKPKEDSEEENSVEDLEEEESNEDSEEEESNEDSEEEESNEDSEKEESNEDSEKEEYNKVSEEESDESLEHSLHPWNRSFINYVEEGAMNGRRILSSWEPFCNAEPVGESTRLDAAALALQHGYERYRQCFQEQDKILQDGHFARTIAAAGAASKSDVWLYMSDKGPNPWDKSFEKIRWGAGAIRVSNHLRQSDLKLFVDPHRLMGSIMVQPRQWWRVEDVLEAEEIPQSLLYELPLAIRRAGARLAGFTVDIYYPYMLNLTLSEDQLSSLGDSTRHVRTFEFRMERHRDFRRLEPNPEALEGFYAFLRAAMGSETVQKLSLKLDWICFSTDTKFRLEPLLGSARWHNLKLVKLEKIDLGLQELQKFMDKLSPGTCCQFKDICLSSGTWAAALDYLRSKVSGDSFLAQPSGAECDLMTDEEYEFLFCTFDEEDNKATRYITSVEGVENPFRKNDEGTEASMEL